MDESGGRSLFIACLRGNQKLLHHKIIRINGNATMPAVPDIPYCLLLPDAAGIPHII
jgi:hypothetical protein